MKKLKNMTVKQLRKIIQAECINARLRFWSVLDSIKPSMVMKEDYKLYEQVTEISNFLRKMEIEISKDCPKCKK